MHRIASRLWAALAIFSVVVAASSHAVEVANVRSHPVAQAGDGKDSATIKMVMQKAMKGGLAKKFATGQTTAEERADMVVLFTTMAGCKSPKGDEKDWNERTAALLAAVTANDTKEFQKALNCAGCHKAHK